jgi:hypothetical protein
MKTGPVPPLSGMSKAAAAHQQDPLSPLPPGQGNRQASIFRPDPLYPLLYLYFRLSTGLARAARTAWPLMVSSATTSTTAPEKTNTPAPIVRR